MQAHGESLNLFSDDLINKAITQVQYVDHLPVSQSGNGFIEFNVTPQNYVDLSRSQLYVKCKVVIDDNSQIGVTIRKTLVPKEGATEEEKDLKDADKRDVLPTNCLLGGLFQKVDLTIQQKNISNDVQTYTYPYKYMVDTLINTTQEIDMGKLFYKDPYGTIKDASFFDEEHSTGSKLYYLFHGERLPPSLSTRAQAIMGSREFEMQGPIDLDFFQQKRLLLHNTNIGLKFFQSSPQFSLMSGQDSPKFNIKILEARLKLCHVNLDPAVTVAISDTLKLKPAQYPYTSSKIHTYTLAKGSSNAVITDLFSGECPQKLFVFMVDSENAAGHFNKNPYVFSDFDLNEIGFYVNNVSLPSKPMKVEHSNTWASSYHVEAWQRLRELNPNSIISYEDFWRGYSIYCFDLGNYNDLPIIHCGSTKLELRFKSPLDQAVTVFTYGQFRSCLSIDAARNVQ